MYFLPHKFARGRIGVLVMLLELRGTVRDKVKGDSFPIRAMKAYRGSRDMRPLILNLRHCIEVSGNFTSRPRYTTERTSVQMD